MSQGPSFATYGYICLSLHFILHAFVNKQVKSSVAYSLSLLLWSTYGDNYLIDSIFLKRLFSNVFQHYMIGQDWLDIHIFLAYLKYAMITYSQSNIIACKLICLMFIIIDEECSYNVLSIGIYIQLLKLFLHWHEFSLHFGCLYKLISSMQMHQNMFKLFLDNYE